MEQVTKADSPAVLSLLLAFLHTLLCRDSHPYWDAYGEAHSKAACALSVADCATETLSASPPSQLSW